MFFPTLVQAQQLLSDIDIQGTINSLDNIVRVQQSDVQFIKHAQIDDQTVAAANTIESFHKKLLENRKSSLPAPQMIPILNDGITIIFPHYPLAKRIGDRFVQTRFIRNQVYNLLNRSLLQGHSSEAVQINTLYLNAFEFTAVNTAKFGDAISQAAVNSFGKDFIWPELRLINNEQVLVPVLHLTDLTVNQQTVNGHQVEFGGPVAEFNSITIESGTLRTYRDTFLKTAEDLVVQPGGSIQANGDLNLLVGGTLQNISGTLSAAQNINIIAGQYVQKTMVHTFSNGTEQGTRLGKIASVDAQGNISIQSYSDLVLQGGSISGNTIVLRSDGNISLVTQQTTVVNNQVIQGGSSSQSTIEHLASKLSAQDSIYLIATGAIELNAATLHADKGVIKLLAEQGVYISNAFNQFQSERSSKVRKVTEQEQEFQTIAIRASLEAGKGVLIASTLGDIIMQAASIKSGEGTEINARNGKVNLMLAKEQDHYYYNKVKKGTWKIKTETKQDQTENAVYNSIVGGVKVHASHGVTLEFAQKEGQTLQQTLADMAGTQDLAWMNTLYNDPQFTNNIELVYQKLEELHIHKKTSNLSPAAMAVIAIAVAVAMGPAGAGWLGSGTNAIGASSFANAAAMQAGALTLATQATTGLASGKGIGGTLESMLQEDSIRSLAVSMVTAGVLDHIGDYGSDFFGAVDKNAQFLSSDTLISLGNQATQAVVQATVSAGISTVINGGGFSSFSQSFSASLKQAGIAAVGEYMSSSIGKAYKNTDINGVIRYVAHAGAGCVLGLASKEAGSTSGGGQESCLTGAGGAVVGEAIADVYKAQKLEELFNKHKSLTDELKANGATDAQIAAIYTSSSAQNHFNKEVAKLTAAGVDLAKLGGAISAYIAGADVNLAAMTAENAAEHNAFFLIPLGLMVLKGIDIALTANELYDIYETLAKDPAQGQNLLEQWLMEQAAGGLIGKAIPGFKTFDELLDWLKRNDVVSSSMLKDIKDNVDSGKSNASSGSITVHNAIDKPLDLKNVAGEFEFITKVSGLHDAKINDGFYGEQIAAQLFKDATNLDFTDIVKNKSNNGADLLAIDLDNKTIWLVEVKSSQRDKFPNPDSLDLKRRGTDWIDQVANGKLWNQPVTAEAKAYAIDLKKKLDSGVFTLKPILAKVQVPAPGQTGVATVKVTPAG
ncbi:MAG: DUF637 domain-containing protein [Gammaproteobacteria bacterium]|nr:DUF637 domain-containing protein [Gammaproteobacteria bacterium]MBU2059415.1 DUF637 domain-containing protein [Gammaproteobacteria bacterium]MBU2175205.1 DUF637 domain-containing protein [Gammaproteobacteria bacterium]MBU2247413.1 DUF637 domain-containing protein [Gammaproteobacteria bacterium]MBU2346320.1 DUF637 domain-containing protein [Gammaproteobacteria bacterium]